MSVYRLTTAARDDLLEIWLYVFEQAQSEGRADRVVRSLRDACELLAASPAMGKAHEMLGSDVRVHYKSDYIIAYRQADDGVVEILRFVGGAQDLLAAFER